MIWVFIIVIAAYVLIAIRGDRVDENMASENNKPISDPRRLLTEGTLVSRSDLTASRQGLRRRIVIPMRYDIVRGPWPSLREKVLKRDDRKCSGCGVRVNLQVHHIIPLSLGGRNVMENLTTLCKECHQRKHPQTLSDKFEIDNLSSYGFNYKVKGSKISIINSSLRDKKDLVIDYLDKSNRITHRRITPKEIIHQEGRYYLVSHCHLRNDGRTFRISRITSVELCS